MRFQSILLGLFIFSLTALTVVQFQKTKGLRTIASVSEGEGFESDEVYAAEPAVDPAVEIIPFTRSSSGGGFRLQNAVLSMDRRQPFLAAVREVFGVSGGASLFETGQMLTPDFRRAISPTTQQNLCSDFIDDNGDYGDLGRMIIYGFQLFPELSPLIDDSAATKAGMKEVCPRFAQMTRDQRKDYWVWIMATVALFESTCGYDTVNESNRHAVGMFQLNESIADRAPRALLNNGLCGRLTKAQIAPATNNTACALDFMRDSFSGRMEHAPAGLITEAQQFERLRNANPTIIRVLKKFQLCQNTPPI